MVKNSELFTGYAEGLVGIRRREKLYNHILILKIKIVHILRVFNHPHGLWDSCVKVSVQDYMSVSEKPSQARTLERNRWRPSVVERVAEASCTSLCLLMRYLTEYHSVPVTLKSLWVRHLEAVVYSW